MRFDRVERGWLLGLELVLSVLLILSAVAGGGLLARMILAAGAIQGVLLARGRQARHRRELI